MTEREILAAAFTQNADGSFRYLTSNEHRRTVDRAWQDLITQERLTPQQQERAFKRRP